MEIRLFLNILNTIVIGTIVIVAFTVGLASYSVLREKLATRR